MAEPVGTTLDALIAKATASLLVQGFDNSPDIRAIKLRYGKDYRQHLQERVPHQHSADDALTLTEPMNIDAFIAWLKANLPE